MNIAAAVYLTCWTADKALQHSWRLWSVCCSSCTRRPVVFGGAVDIEMEIFHLWSMGYEYLNPV